MTLQEVRSHVSVVMWLPYLLLRMVVAEKAMTAPSWLMAT